MTSRQYRWRNPLHKAFRGLPGGWGNRGPYGAPFPQFSSSDSQVLGKCSHRFSGKNWFTQIWQIREKIVELRQAGMAGFGGRKRECHEVQVVVTEGQDPRFPPLYCRRLIISCYREAESMTARWKPQAKYRRTR